MNFYTYKRVRKRSQKLPGTLEEYIFSHENPKSFWGPKVGPRPHAYICLLCLHNSTPLCQKDWVDQSWPPPFDRYCVPKLLNINVSVHPP